MKNVIVETDGNIFDPTDYESKLSEVKQKLETSIIAPFVQQQDLVAEEQEEFGGGNKRFKSRVEVESLSPLLVSSKLNEILRVYRPLSQKDVQDFEEQDLLCAFECFMQLITYLNQFTNFIPSKQQFCAFANITTSTYNEMLKNGAFSSIFESVEDYLVDQNFMASQAGLAKEKTTITRLQTQGNQGHDLRKTVEVVNLTQNNLLLDHDSVDKKLKTISSNFGFTKRIENK